MAGRNSVPLKAVEARREYTIGLKLAGVSMATILKQLNTLAPVKGWGIVSRRTVERDVADYFRKNKPLSQQDYDHLDQLRTAFLAQMEITIEKASLHMAKNKKNWKPFEYMAGLESLHKMQMNYAEAQNWNLGKQNINVNIQQNNINNIFEAAAADLETVKPEAINDLVSYLDKTISKMENNQEDKNIIEGKISN
jgi:DNA-binding ferritin-like protein (Dps family)